MKAGGSRECFEEYDVNHDGKLSMAEVGLENLVDISIRLENLICQGYYRITRSTSLVARITSEAFHTCWLSGVRDRYTESRFDCCGVKGEITVQITGVLSFPLQIIYQCKCIDQWVYPAAASSCTFHGVGIICVSGVHRFQRGA